MLRRSDLSRLLFEKIKDKTEVIFGDELSALHNNPPSFAKVKFRREGERRFDLVIGADGLHSNVRALVFGPQVGSKSRSAMSSRLSRSGLPAARRRSICDLWLSRAGC